MTYQALLALLLTLARILPGPLDAQEVHQSPRVVIASEGESINITCSTRGDLEGILMKRIWPQASSVIYFEDGEEPTVDETFSGRIAFSGSQKNLTITMHLLQLADTGAYTCEAVRKVSVHGLFTTVMVREKPVACKPQESLQTSVFLPVAIAIGFFLIGVLCSVLKKTQIKKLCASGNKDSPCVVSYSHVLQPPQNPMHPQPVPVSPSACRPQCLFQQSLQQSC